MQVSLSKSLIPRGFRLRNVPSLACSEKVTTLWYFASWSFVSFQPRRLPPQWFSKVESSPDLWIKLSPQPSPPRLPYTRKAAARTALVGLNEPARALCWRKCFRQFGIETVVVTANAAERLHKEKFEACVLSLGDGADAVMEAARTSPSNSRCVIYGVGGNAQEAMRYSKYGINAMFNEPLERPAALKLIRATRMLVLHEFRRYVRIPVMTEVSVVGDGRRIVAPAASK